jgi:hypothetical protein
MRRFRTYEREPLLATLADTTTILPIDTTPRGDLVYRDEPAQSFDLDLRDHFDSTRQVFMGMDRNDVVDVSVTVADERPDYPGNVDLEQIEALLQGMERERARASVATSRYLLPFDCGLDDLPSAVEYAINRARYEHGFAMPIGRCQTVGEPGHRMHILQTRTGPPAIYVVVEDQHYGGGQPRLWPLSSVVHILQNLGDSEASEIEGRPPR